MVRRRVPLIVGLLLLIALTLAIAIASLRSTNGELTYALDDPYIHMAVAKSMAQHGVWGINASSFSASSSSPLWTALLSLFFAATGVRDTIPLLLNVAFAIGTILLVWSMMASERLSIAASTAVVGAIVLTAPLAPMIWVGMEHSLQILLVFYVLKRVRLVADAGLRGVGETFTFAAACGAMVATRYEGLFLICGCLLLFAMNRRFVAALVCSLAGVLPIVGVGLWNLSHGWFFLPASIVVKRAVFQSSPTVDALWGNIWTNLLHSDAPAALLLLLLTALVLLVLQQRQRDHVTGTAGGGIMVFAVTGVLHLLFGRFGFGWFYRYEAYLLALGVATVVPAMFRVPHNQCRQRWLGLQTADWALMWLLLFAITALARAVPAHLLTAAATKNIYEQQRQVARLVHRYYDDETIVVNDIGAVSYYSNARVVDVMGIATLDLARARIDNRLTAEAILQAAEREQAGIAIVYENWFKDSVAFRLPWRLVGRWTIADPVVVDPTVSFFALDAQHALSLHRALMAIQRDLPVSIAVRTDF